jgi:hypothetical protein
LEIKQKNRIIFEGLTADAVIYTRPRYLEVRGNHEVKYLRYWYSEEVDVNVLNSVHNYILEETMSLNKRFSVSLVFALLLATFVTGTAFAHYCTPPNKKDGAGSIGVYNVVTEEFTPAKRFSDADGDGFPDMFNSGFVTLTDGANFSYDIFVHQTLPDGALAAGPGGDDQCDGQGVDSFLACIGF